MFWDLFSYDRFHGFVLFLFLFIDHFFNSSFSYYYLFVLIALVEGEPSWDSHIVSLLSVEKILAKVS